MSCNAPIYYNCFGIKCLECKYCPGKSVPIKIFYGHPEFYKILDELKDLHSRKNQDYANENPLSNLKMCERGGIPAWKGVVVRLTDKISRLLSFTSKESYAVKDESVEDTFRDAAIYAILGLILYRETKK
jgi:hypothetical protein